MTVEFTLNGAPQRVEVPPHWTLLRMLRDVVGRSDAKHGCGEGVCGACAVLVDGVAMNSCSVLAPQVEGASVATVGGLAEDGKLHLAFVPLKWEKPMVSAIEIAPGVRGRMAPIRITTAPHDVTDHAGRVWRADRYFTGGLSLRPAEAVTGTADDELFAFHRFGHFTYTIPVAADGRYTVKLRFSEHNFGPGRPGGASVGRRVFHVFCNGEALLRNFDMLAEAGPVKPIEKVFRNLQPSAQSKLVLQFTPVKNYALINTIEVLDESGS